LRVRKILYIIYAKAIYPMNISNAIHVYICSLLEKLRKCMVAEMQGITDVYSQEPHKEKP